MDREETPESTLSRREVLKRAPIALAAGFALTALIAKPLLSRLGRRRSAPVFPKGSIFTPAGDPRDRS